MSALIDRSCVRRKQDLELIELAAFIIEEMQELGDMPSFDTTPLSELTESMTDAPSTAGATTSMPILRLAPGGRYQLVIEGPNSVIDFDEYWESWTHFCTYWFTAAEEERSPDSAEGQIFAAISERKDLSAIQRLTFLDKLWKDRWILDGASAGRLIGETERSVDIVQDERRLSELLASTAAALRSAKDTTTSLDEWFEALRDLSPQVNHGYILSHALGDNRTHRFFDELAADMGALLYGNLRRQFSSFSFSQDHLHPDGFSGKRPSLEELRYNLNARIFYPRFWFDLAVEWLGDTTKRPPAELDSYDPVTAVACAISDSVEGSVWLLGLDVAIWPED